jgi:hypothetical protein
MSPTSLDYNYRWRIPTPDDFNLLHAIFCEDGVDTYEDWLQNSANFVNGLGNYKTELYLKT